VARDSLVNRKMTLEASKKRSKIKNQRGGRGRGYAAACAGAAVWLTACSAAPGSGETDSLGSVQSGLCVSQYPNACGSSLWPGGAIPWEFDSALPQSARDNMSAAMTEWDSQLEGVIWFRPKTPSDTHYLRFTNTPGCGVAMRSDVVVNFPAADCIRLSGTTTADIRVDGHALHELGHIIGFEHTQNRDDRDRYLETSSIAFMQTLPMCSATDTVGEPVTKCKPNSPTPELGDGPGNTLGVFDVNSIMLYGSTGGFTPTTCALFSSQGGDWFRLMVKRGFSIPSAPPCPADIPEHWNTSRITAHDTATAIEMYRTKNGWAPFTPMGRDVGSTQPLAFSLTGSVYARGNPAVAAVGQTSIITVTRGSDGNVYYAVTAGSGTGTTFNSLGRPAPTLLGDPAVVSWSQSTARVDIVIVGQAANDVPRVWKRAFANGAWEGAWESSMGIPAGVTLQGGVALASWGTDRLDIFANDNNKRLWHQSWNPGYGGWDQPGGQCPGGQLGRPAAVSWGPGRIDIVARAADSSIYQLVWDSAGWSSWIKLISVNSAHDPAIASYQPSHLEIFTGGAANRLYQLTCLSGTCKSASSWTGWWPFGGIITSSPAASSPRGFARVDVIAKGDDGSALPTPNAEGGLWHKWWPWQ